MSEPDRDWFARYPAPARPISPVILLRDAGGLSGSSLYRYQSRLGPLVAKFSPVVGGDPSRLRTVHDWLERSRSLSYVPQPIRTIDGASIVDSRGRFGELYPWKPGQADPDRPPRPTRLAAGFCGLARFLKQFEKLESEGPSPGLDRRATEVDWWLGCGFAELTARIAEKPEDPASILAARWIAQARPLARAIGDATRRASVDLLPIQPCLRDARPEHFLFEGDELTGLVDFAAMGRDSVAGDLARLLGEWVGANRAAEQPAFEAFEAIRPLARTEHAAIRVFQQANALLMAGRWARWHFLEGRRFDPPGAVLAGLQRGLDRLREFFSRSRPD